jgi:hypothetical protein
VRLTTAELLKNYFFSTADIQLYRDNWEAVFEADSETRAYWDQEVTTGRLKRSLIDLFFDSLLQILVEDSEIEVKEADKKAYDDYKAEKVIFVITTDGLENASSRYSYADVKRAIDERTEEGWEFIFLGANIDAVGEAGRLGIRADRAATYVADSYGSTVMYDAVADATCCMRQAPAAAPIGGGWKRAIERDTAKRRR